MQIEKWYLDCVTPAGAGMIGYAARINFGPFALRVSESLQWSAPEPSARNRTALGGSLPTMSSDGVNWTNPVLDIQGRWQPIAPGIPTVSLHDDPAGRIEWTCLCPAAQTRVSLGTNRYDGQGYAEKLILTLPPSKLPLCELIWGRFIAGPQSCVWIRWVGTTARSWCFHNGRPVDAVHDDQCQLAWPGHRLQLERGATLRSGRIADTAFGETRWLRRLLPAAIRDVNETKWCSPGVLTDAAGQKHPGWAIHEVAAFA